MNGRARAPGDIGDPRLSTCESDRKLILGPSKYRFDAKGSLSARGAEGAAPRSAHLPFATFAEEHLLLEAGALRSIKRVQERVIVDLLLGPVDFGAHLLRDAPE